jgi:hypothetical protein
MITKEQKIRIDILFKQIGNLESSDSSTMTDLSVCRDLISQKFDVNLSYMDICCGKGTILLFLYLEYWNFLENIIPDIEERNKFIHSKIAGNDISKAQVDIAKSTMIKVQKILKVKNLLDFNIYNYNILDEKNNLDELKKKFTCVITNPPYNGLRGEGGNLKSLDIYPEFIEKAYEMADRYVIMITKSHWMNKPSMKTFRERMINEFNVDKIVHYQENPFKGTQISGGVSYFVIDNQNTKETFELNGVVYDRKVALDFLPYELNTEELKVLNKFLNFKKLDLSNFKAEGYYGISTNDDRLISDENGIKCHVSEQKGRIKYLPLDKITDKIRQDLNKPKIFSTSSYGANPYALGRILCSDGNEICSQSLVSWNFENIDEMKTFYEYLNSKVFRFAISLLKNKQNVSKTVFSLVPHIDFSKLEKVDDENINKYLNLTEEDIQTIGERCERLRLLR